MDIVERLRQNDHGFDRSSSHSEDRYVCLCDHLAREAADEIERLRDYIAKHNELVQKLTIELAEYQAREHKVGIKRAGLAKLGADKTGE